MERMICANTVAVGSGDVAPNTGTPGQATSGNPDVGTPPTQIAAYVANMILEEMRAVVVAGGLTPSSTNWAQVLAALYAMFPGLQSSARSLANPGYIKLPGSLILQWVRNQVATADSSGNATNAWTFPVPFTSAIYGYSYVNTNEASGTSVGTLLAEAPTLTGHTILQLGAPANALVAFSGFIIGA